MYMPLHEKDNGRFKWDYLAAPPQRFATVIHEMARRVDQACPTAPGRERLFLARKPFRLHKLINHRAIETVAEARGFHVVHPEDLDFAEQACLLRRARFVVGPDGSAVNFLTWFAQPGTRLLSLSHDYTIGLPVLTALLSAIGIDVTVLCGRRLRFVDDYPEFADYTIDETAFLGFLDRWLDGEVR